MCSLYSVSRKTRRWHIVIFFYLLNTVGINAKVIHAPNHNFEKRIIQRKLLEEIGQGVVTPFIQILTPPRELRSSIKKFLPTEELVAPRNRPPARGRYNFCLRVQGRKTPFICEGYVKEKPKYVCKEHMKVVRMTV